MPSGLLPVLAELLRTAGAPFEVVKYRYIDEPAGRTLDYIAALKLIRCRVLGE